MTATAFSSLPLHPDLLKNLSSLGYRVMTPIQAQSCPHILAGRDVIAQGKTGSGKTAAFGLGLLEKLDVKRFRVQSLVLCPTRELADQVAKEIRRLARAIHNIKVLTLCGGMPLGPQIGSLEHGAHIVVGTPGRIEDHLKKGTLKLNAVSTLVLDEADRMKPMMATLQIDGGKRQKVRPGDILGALTGHQGITGKQVGKIHISDNWAYVAVSRHAVKPALKKLGEGKLKGRSFRVRLINE